MNGDPPSFLHALLLLCRRFVRYLGMRGVIAVFGSVLIVIVWAAALTQIELDRRATEENAITQNSNLVKAFEEHTVRTIKGIDAALLFVMHEYARLGAQIDIASYIRDGYIDGGLFANIGISDLRGDMLASSQPRTRPINIGDREYFRVHIERDSKRLFFNKPLQSRITGTWTFPMSRRITRADGSFGGVVSVAVDPRYFSDFYQKADLGAHGVVDLIGADGISRARRDGATASVGFDHSGANLLRLRELNPVGNLLTRGIADGNRRFVSYRKLADYPLTIIVGTSEDEVLAPHLQRKRQYLWAAVLVSLIVVLMSALLALAVRRQQAAAAELARINAELESRVASRTAELEAANLELNSFSYTIAHDLRTPVRAIGGFSSLVLRDNENRLDANSVGYLRRVVAGAEHMGQLIDDLLNMARLSRQEMRRQDMNLSELSARVIDALRQAQPQRDVAVTIQPDLHVNADPGLLSALMENLIGNAWKYTGRTAAARIEIGAENHRGKPVYFVRDNGAGFDMQYVHKLFAPFQRLHHPNEFEGTGIGLATVKRIVERHGGRVWIESAVNAGTTAYFTLAGKA